jgi:hypothetical protein
MIAANFNVPLFRGYCEPEFYIDCMRSQSYKHMDYIDWETNGQYVNGKCDTTR